MWALRRASVPLRERRFSIGTFRACFADSEVSITHIQDKATIFESPQLISDTCKPLKRFYRTDRASVNQFMCRRGLSSEAGTKSSGEEDDLEEGFSELETPASTDAVQHINAEDEDELISEPEFSDVDAEPSQNELELSDTENDPSRERPSGKGTASALFKAIMDSPGLSVNNALDKWVEEGNELSRTEISMAMLIFRKFRMYGRALQLSEWLEAKNKIEFVERDYASRLDLIAKVRGLHKAENYVDKIPKSFRSELIYRTLLANCVKANNFKKAEEVFNKMKDLEFPITAFACNQLLLLYKRRDKKKIADVLLLMEKENVKPSLFTYKLLIDTKGKSNDIGGMDQIVEAMKAEGIEPDLRTKSILASHYVRGGLEEKAEAILKEMEGGNLNGNRRACRNLLTLYADLGKADDVGRVWKVCESKPLLEECIAAIEAYGKLNKIEEAEAVFENAFIKYEKPPSKLFNVLLKVYANYKMVAKGKDLVKRMADSGCKIGPFTWDALVKLYVEAGEVEKADSILQKAAQQNQVRPTFSSYMAIMDQYAKRGDIHSTEKVFHRMRQAGYIARFNQFQTLVQAYVNAKAPAYGFRERMKADNIFPNKSLSVQLGQIDAFRKTAASDLLD